MIEEEATIIDHNKEFLWVEAQRKSGCNHCNSTSSCTTSVLAKIFPEKTSVFRLKNQLQLKTGDQVIIGIPDEVLLKSAIWIYLLPLIAMIAGALISNGINFSDFGQFISAITAMTLSFYFIRYYFSNKEKTHDLTPVLLKKIPQTVQPVKFIN